MKRAIIFPEANLTPSGPILRGLIAYRKHFNADILGFADLDTLDDYDEAIIFTNKAKTIPHFSTTCKVGWWMCDLRNPREELTGGVDMIFRSDGHYIKESEEFYKRPVFQVPQSGIDEPMGEGRGVYWTALFIGNIGSNQYHANREPILREVRKYCLLKLINGRSFTQDSKWLYNQTKFNLSISPPATLYTSNRTYNILSAGGFCLISWYPGIEQQFENHKHLVWFKDPSEAVELMRYYQKNEEERIAIAKQGKEFYDQNHTAYHRMQTMFTHLNQLDK